MGKQAGLSLDFLLGEYLAARSLRARSAEQLRLAVHAYAQWLGRRPTTDDLAVEPLARWLRDSLIHNAPATTNSKRRAIVTLWRWASRRGLLSSEAPADVPTAREPRRVPTAWTVAEVEKLVVRARGWPGSVGVIPARLFWPSLYLAVYDTGCRISALLSARTWALSLEQGSLLIEPEEIKNGVGELYWLHPQTVAAIAAHYDPGRELVWPWPYHRNTLWAKSARIIRAAGLTIDPKGRGQFHRLRRTCISYCAAVSPALATQQAGHADPRVTARYIDPRIARRQSAVDVLPRPGA